MDEISDWINLADKFAADGNAQAMFGAANEILELDNDSADGRAIMAEANLYLSNLSAAENLAPDNLRGRLVKGGIAAENFKIIDATRILGAVIDEARAVGDTNILFKALTWSVNPLYLAGDARTAADNLRDASTLTNNIERAAELYSKHLFLSNYNSPADKTAACAYDNFFANVSRYGNFSAGDKIRVGYISPDFRQHAVANFVKPLINDFDADNFSVTVYHTGRSDFVTAKLKNAKINWRDLSGFDADTAAKIIHADGIDILVDLSGHTQNSCLPILARKPAPVQITAIGYTATTGLSAVDYFLSDTISAATENNFTEKILRVDGCHLCYAPVIDTPAAARHDNNPVTYGSFNNFAKVTDAVLNVWREILLARPDARLVIKNKTCSIADGRAIITNRLRRNNIPVERVELRPYSADYLEQYADIDVALDTFPVNGGTTTCEALYMGVPVIVLRGDSHGSNFGASILNAAGLNEFVAQDTADYIDKAVNFVGYRGNLREKVSRSRLMDGRRYMRELEGIYRRIHKPERNA